MSENLPSSPPAYSISSETWEGEECLWKRIVIDINSTYVIQQRVGRELIALVFDYVADTITEDMPDLENYDTRKPEEKSC